MVIGIFGESCTGKSTLAEKIAADLRCEVFTGKDYLRLAKNENIAKVMFQKKLNAAVNGENIIYVISEKEHLVLLPTESIFAHAFDRCTSLESITLGKNVKKIGGSAFEECTSLKVITIPASIEELGAWVFCDTNITDIYFGVSAPGENWSEKWNQYLDESVNIR